ncbi:MAG: hypothetical protein KKE86_00695, partial [Planctomycetes bacterium]|nr:hypothetical protein [Planctomycetota bacterium]
MHYKELFDSEDAASLDDTGTFRLMLADAALTAIVDKLVDSAKSAVEAGGIVQSSASEVERISRRFARVVPAENVICLADIINAAWHVSEDETLWLDVPQLRNDKDKKDRQQNLRVKTGGLAVLTRVFSGLHFLRKCPACVSFHWRNQWSVQFSVARRFAISE